MWERLGKHLITTISGIVGAAAIGAATNVQLQGPTKEAAINGAIMGAATGIIGALGGAARDPGKSNIPGADEINKRIGGDAQ